MALVPCCALFKYVQSGALVARNDGKEPETDHQEAVGMKTNAGFDIYIYI